MTAAISTIPAAEYHRDPADVPSLSASVASILCTSSPLHAWTSHPRLNPNYEPEEADRFDLGTVAHALLLEGITKAVVVDAPDWRTNVAKEERDAIRAAGHVPLLVKDLARAEEMVAAARVQLEAYAAAGESPPLFDDGEAEQTIIWREPDSGVVCRSRVDWLRRDRAAIDDYKTTGRSANPARFARNLYSVGQDVQAAFHILAVERACGVTPRWRWVVQETFPPYALSVVTPSEPVLTIARKKVRYAIETWRRCLERDEWPGYRPKVAWAELPPWEEESWLAREIEEEDAA